MTPNTIEESGQGPRTLLVARQRIAIAHSDHAGLIYYSRPLEWQEALTTQWLATIGRPVSSLIAAGFAFPVATVQCTYHRATGLDDEVQLELRVLKVGRTSFGLGLVCLDEAGSLCIELAITHVWSATTHAAGERAQPVPTPLPGWLRQALSTSVPKDRLSGADIGIPCSKRDGTAADPFAC